jgi:hypothetical protein
LSTEKVSISLFRSRLRTPSVMFRSYGVRDLLDGLAHQLGTRVAEDGAQLVVDSQELPVAPDVSDAHGGPVERGAKPLLALAQLFQRLDAPAHLVNEAVDGGHGAQQVAVGTIDLGEPLADRADDPLHVLESVLRVAEDM